MSEQEASFVQARSGIAPCAPVPMTVIQIQDELRNFPPAEPGPLLHLFMPGVYVRTIILHEGICVVGKRHGQDHICIVAGDCSVRTDEDIQRYTGYHIFNTPKGTKRAVYAHSDTYISTIHRTDKTDLTDIEADVMIPDDFVVADSEKLS
jgi:hypothetical protein